MDFNVNNELFKFKLIGSITDMDYVYGACNFYTTIYYHKEYFTGQKYISAILKSITLPIGSRNVPYYIIILLQGNSISNFSINDQYYDFLAPAAFVDIKNNIINENIANAIYQKLESLGVYQSWDHLNIPPRDDRLNNVIIPETFERLFRGKCGENT